MHVAAIAWRYQHERNRLLNVWLHKFWTTAFWSRLVYKTYIQVLMFCYINWGPNVWHLVLHILVFFMFVDTLQLLSMQGYYIIL